MQPINFNKYEQLLDRSYEMKIGKVVKMVGLTIEATGPEANLNDVCYITDNKFKEKKIAEVVAFSRIGSYHALSDMTGLVSEVW